MYMKDMWLKAKFMFKHILCIFYNISHITLLKKMLPWCSGRAFAAYAEDQGSIPGQNRPNSLKQVVMAPQPNARQQEWVLRVLRDDHYKRMPRVTVGVAR